MGFKFHDLLTVPNLLSLSRVPIALLMVLVYPAQVPFLSLLIISALTDWLDGTTARRKGTTALGAFLDPMCDKLFIGIVVIFLIIVGQIKLWHLGILLMRDVYVVLLLAIFSFHPKKQKLKSGLKARVPGKVTTGCQYIALVWIFIGLGYFEILLALVALVSIISIFDYTWLVQKRLK